MTCCWSSGQGCGCTFIIYACAFYTTHCSIVNCYAYGMLNSGEGCKNSLVGIYGQGEWVVSQYLAIYGPVEELVTCVSSCGEGCGCTFVVYTCAFYTTHCSIVNCYAYGMLNSGEGCKNSLVGIYSQCEWIVSQCLAIYGPTYELVTCVSCCGESSGCTLVINTSALYTTHSCIVHSSCYSMLDCCKGC